MNNEILERIKDEVCMGTYGLVELDLRKITRENEENKKIVESIKSYIKDEFSFHGGISEDKSAREILMDISTLADGNKIHKPYWH
jgi:hypothetical protein